MKKIHKILLLLFMAGYMACLLSIGIRMFRSAGKPADKTISVYREDHTQTADTEDGTKNRLPSEQDDPEAVSQEKAVRQEPQELQAAETVIVKRLGYPIVQDEYNGQELQDNGLEYAIKVNRQENIVTVYQLDAQGYYTVPVRSMCCSVSADDTTPLGLFTTSDRYEWALLEGGVYGQYAYKIYGGILFHSVPYVMHSHSQLETWEYNKLGTGASLGCVRLCVADAKWIYENCAVGTQVNIFDSDYTGPLGKPQPACVLEDSENPGWDPTDMTEGNPYRETGQIFGVSSHTIQAGDPFDSMAGVMAFSKEGEDVTSRLTVKGEVDTGLAGEYPLTYTFYDQGEAVTASAVITVKDHEKPVIARAPENIVLSGYDGDTAELAEFIGSYITAYDGERQISTIYNLQSVPEEPLRDAVVIDVSEVKTEAGEYRVYVYAADHNGNQSEIIMITVHIVV